MKCDATKKVPRDYNVTKAQTRYPKKGKKENQKTKAQNEERTKLTVI